MTPRTNSYNHNNLMRLKDPPTDLLLALDIWNPSWQVSWKNNGCSYQFHSIPINLVLKKGHLILNDSTWILGGSSVGISHPSLPEVLPAHPRAMAALCRQLAKMTRWWCRMPSWAAGWIKHARFVFIVFKQMQTTRMILDDWLKPHKT